MVGGVALGMVATVAITSPSQAGKVVARATLIDNAGTRVGDARFTSKPDGLVVGRLRVSLPADSPEFHGLHLHTNADGAGCVAGSGFTGVGGHWDVGGHTHGAHTGDLPSLARRGDGHSELRFVLDKFGASEIVGKAIVVHAGPDNFANVPLGASASQYTDNGSAFTGAPGAPGTASTGNSGARFACGIIGASGG